MKPWERYEVTSRQLIDRVKADLELKSVDGKSKIRGKHSGTTWTLDAVGFREDGATVVIEFRRKRRRLSQEDVAAVAYQSEIPVQ